jgi:hypothetical protein
LQRGIAMHAVEQNNQYKLLLANEIKEQKH